MNVLLFRSTPRPCVLSAGEHSIIFHAAPAHAEDPPLRCFLCGGCGCVCVCVCLCKRTVRVLVQSTNSHTRTRPLQRHARSNDIAHTQKETQACTHTVRQRDTVINQSNYTEGDQGAPSRPAKCTTGPNTNRSFSVVYSLNCRR